VQDLASERGVSSNVIRTQAQGVSEQLAAIGKLKSPRSQRAF
jgi:hypothetical protein